MKLTNVIATGAMLVALAFIPVVSFAQSSDTKQDTKDLHKAEDKKAKNVAQRNEAEKNGHPKQAVKDEKKVQKDNKEIHKDRKDLKEDKSKK